MKRLKDILLCVLLITLVGFVLWNGGKGLQGYKDGTTVPDTVRVVVYDTLTYYKPVPKDSVVIRYITEKLPISEPQETNLLNFANEIPVGSKTDSVEVQIPITQKIYEDSIYTAYVSGYNPSLDSLIFRIPQETMTITKYTKPKRWSIGIQAGYGMTLKGMPQFTPYIGVGISCNLFSF